jgi:hypothetical protein
MFSRNEIYRFVNLVDSSGNQFEVLVKKINKNIYLPHGWYALKDFYNISIGACVILLYTGRGQFSLILKDMFGVVIDPPTFKPPMKFIFENCVLGLTL